MKEYVLDYYPKFKCVAGKCKHTCCAGWEMNIDEQSLCEYKKDESAFSQALKRGIDFRKSKFKADKFKRCAFLNSDGLCEIIINLGEKSLCQVCRDHPRFRSFFSDRVEMGLGFCCEEATKIILTHKDKITPVLINDNSLPCELDFNEQNVMKFRESALNVLQDRTLDINDRLNNLLRLSNACVCEKDFKKIIKTFLSFERLDKTWTKRLKSVKKAFNLTTPNDLSHYCEQFLANSLYRHLADAEDTMSVRARTIACIISWWVINNVIELEKNENQDLLSVVIDVVRAYSAEVEYSQKNLDKLFSLCYKFIKL